MVEITFVIKASKFCNLRCVYCYEHRELGVRDQIGIDTLEHLFAGIDAFGAWLLVRGIAPSFSFVWHGGEPLLLPPEFYEHAAEAQRRHIRRFAYRNSLQTNLFGIDQGSLAFVQQAGWHLGVSLDFASGVRRNAGGHDADARVIAAAEALRRSGGRFGAISVLGAHNRDTLLDAYDWVAEFAGGWRILPMFEGGPEADIARLKLSEAEIVRFFAELLERRAHAGKHISIAPLDDYLKWASLKIADMHASAVADRDMLDSIFLVNVNGDVFTRPFAYEPRHCLGNIARDAMGDMLERDVYKSCQDAIRGRKLQNCATCESRGFCDTSPMHEHGAVTREDGRCAIARDAIARIEQDLRESGVDKSVIAGWVEMREGANTAVEDLH
ncbi:MAG TPA: radical SAM protein [Rhizomicrobium sp.]